MAKCVCVCVCLKKCRVSFNAYHTGNISLLVALLKGGIFRQILVSINRLFRSNSAQIAQFRPPGIVFFSSKFAIKIDIFFFSIWDQVRPVLGLREIYWMKLNFTQNSSLYNIYLLSLIIFFCFIIFQQSTNNRHISFY